MSTPIMTPSGMHVVVITFLFSSYVTQSEKIVRCLFRQATRCSSDAALITVELASILAASSFVNRQRNRESDALSSAELSRVAHELRFRFMTAEETWNNLSS